MLASLVHRHRAIVNRQLFKLIGYVTRHRYLPGVPRLAHRICPFGAQIDMGQYFNGVIALKHGIQYGIQSDYYLDYATYLWGSSDPVLDRLLEHVIRVVKRTISPPFLIIEVGSNTGLYSLKLATLLPQGKLICFEPNKAAYSSLAANMRRNKHSSVVLENKAIGATCGVAEFYCPPGLSHSDRSSLKPTVSGDNQSHYSVQVETIDYYLNATARGDIVALMKIDIEGLDAECLLGAVQTIELYHPYIIFEYAPSLLDEHGLSVANRVLDMLSTAYRFFIAEGRYLRMVPLTQLPSKTVNILAVPIT